MMMMMMMMMFSMEDVLYIYCVYIYIYVYIYSLWHLIMQIRWNTYCTYFYIPLVVCKERLMVTRSGCKAPCPRNSEMALATDRLVDPLTMVFCNGCKGHLLRVQRLEFQVFAGLDFDISFCSTRNSQGKIWAVHWWLSDLVALSKQTQWKSGIRCPPLHWNDKKSQTLICEFSIPGWYPGIPQSRNTTSLALCSFLPKVYINHNVTMILYNTVTN